MDGMCGEREREKEGEGVGKEERKALLTEKLLHS